MFQWIIRNDLQNYMASHSRKWYLFNNAISRSDYAALIEDIEEIGPNSRYLQAARKDNQEKLHDSRSPGQNWNPGRPN
jgi:hypothetical protein